MLFAINIETETWNRVITSLMKDGWTVSYKYDGIDSGIDADFVVLKKDDEEIIFGWDNWVEGEIKCSQERLHEISKLAGVPLTLGEPVNLKPEVIQSYMRSITKDRGPEE